MSRLSTVPILFATRVPDLGSTHGGDPSARAEPRPIGWCRHCARAMHLGAVSSVLAIVGVYDSARFLSSAWILVSRCSHSPRRHSPVRATLHPIRGARHRPDRAGALAGRHSSAAPRRHRHAYQDDQWRIPLHVELAIGLTDIAFGLSATLLYPFARSGRISADALAV